MRVVRLLGRVRAARALPLLRPLLDHRDPALRRATVQAIGAIGDPGGAAILIDLLDDRDAETRFEAARALGAAASRDTVRTLTERLVSERPLDRHAVALALGDALARLGGELPGPSKARAREALAATARGVDDALAARAIDALGRWADPSVAPILVEMLGHTSPGRRASAALALGEVDTDAARRALRELLATRELPLRTAALAALGEIGDASDAARILSSANAEPWPAKGAASFALVRLARRGALTASDETRRTLCTLAASHGPYVRANAAVALAALGAPECPDGVDPQSFMENRHAPSVQAAGATWLAAAAAAGTTDPDAAREALVRCADEAISAEVRHTCEDARLPPLDDEADVYAWSTDGRELLRDHLVALRLADRSVWIARTDANGHLRLRHAPRGRLVLDDPATVNLEP